MTSNQVIILVRSITVKIPFTGAVNKFVSNWSRIPIVQNTDKVPVSI